MTRIIECSDLQVNTCFYRIRGCATKMKRFNLLLVSSKNLFNNYITSLFLKIQIKIITESDAHVKSIIAIVCDLSIYELKSQTIYYNPHINIVPHIFINVNSYFEFFSKNSRNSRGDIENKSTSVMPSITASAKTSSIECVNSGAVGFGFLYSTVFNCNSLL